MFFSKPVADVIAAKEAAIQSAKLEQDAKQNYNAVESNETVDDIADEVGIDLSDDNLSDDPFQDIFGVPVDEIEDEEGNTVAKKELNLLGRFIHRLVSPVTSLMVLGDVLRSDAKPSQVIDNLSKKILVAAINRSKVPTMISNKLVKTGLNKTLNKVPLPGGLTSDAEEALKPILVPIMAGRISSIAEKQVMDKLILPYLQKMYGVSSLSGAVFIAMYKSSNVTISKTATFLIDLDQKDLKGIFGNNIDSVLNFYTSFLTDVKKRSVILDFNLAKILLDKLRVLFSHALFKNKNFYFLAGLLFIGIVFVFTFLDIIMKSFKKTQESLLETKKLLELNFFTSLFSKAKSGLKVLKELLKKFFLSVINLGQIVKTKLLKLPFLKLTGLAIMLNAFRYFFRYIIIVIKKLFKRRK